MLTSLRHVLLSLAAVAGCLTLTVVALAAMKFGREPGESFAHGVGVIASVVWRRSLLPGNNDHNWFDVLVAATPILLTGLCVVVSFRVSVLNIGGEGQFVIGAVAATAAGLVAKTGALPALLVASAACGATFASVSAALAAWRRVPVVLSTLLLNFVAATLLGAALQGPLHESGAALQSEQLPPSARLPHFHLGDVRTRLHAGFAIAVGAAMFVAVLLRLTVFGFHLRATGENPTAARFAGIATGRTSFLALALSGALAGLAGGIQISGVPPFQLQPGAAGGGFGFTGIAVALLARLSPIGAVFSAIFFGWLQTAFARLQAEQEVRVPYLAAQAAQGLILVTMLILTSGRLPRWRLPRWPRA